VVLIDALYKHFSMVRARRRSRKRKFVTLKRRMGGMKRRRKQKGGALGAGLALGMLAPMLLGTLGKVLKVNV
jgi:hypothetical protein